MVGLQGPGGPKRLNSCYKIQSLLVTMAVTSNLGGMAGMQWHLASIRQQALLAQANNVATLTAHSGTLIVSVAGLAHI